MSVKTTISKAKDFIKHIAADKKMHLIAGVFICGFCSMFWGYCVGIVAAAVAGAAKEIYDYTTKKGTPEILDFAYTCAGALIFAVISVLLTLLLKVMLF